jgi:hypothetical protein
VELLNGVAHLLFALTARGCFPGALTAPLLIVFAVLLMRDLRQVA